MQKLATQVLLNSASEKSALASIRSHGIQNAAALVRDIKSYHRPIAKYFHSRIGIKLQCEDSEIAREVMQTLMCRGIPVLPIHDSFIVQRKQLGYVDDVMMTALNVDTPASRS